jgi:hypothetical protein
MYINRLAQAAVNKLRRDLPGLTQNSHSLLLWAQAHCTRLMTRGVLFCREQKPRENKIEFMLQGE